MNRNLIQAQENMASTPPNIILIVADDLGWNDVGYHGSEILTPTMDSLAAMGLELNRFYAHPACSPTRSALMTGKAPIRLGFHTPLSKNNRKGLPLSEKVLPQYLKDLGYQTSLIGKWHLGRFKKAYLPNQRGFDHFYGYLTGGIGHFDHVHGGGLDWQRNGKTVVEEGYSTHLLTDEAILTIRDHQEGTPFFLEICYSAPHIPNEAPEEAVVPYYKLPEKNRQLHAAMVSEIDKGIERIMQEVQANDLLSNTIIWFMSDNGGSTGEGYNENIRNIVNRANSIFDPPFPIPFLEFLRRTVETTASDNSPLRKGKGSVYEGGVRVPSFIYAPAFLLPQKVKSRITVNDILPTLLTASGYHDGEQLEIDGISQWAFLRGEAPAAQTDYITHAILGNEAYFTDSLKLIIPTDGPPELYNIFDDPTERNNLADDNEAIVAELVEKVNAFPRGESVHDPIWKTALDPDFFGGEIDREPYAEVEGFNAGPTHPAHVIIPALLVCLLSLIGFLIRRWRLKKRRT
ncbi:MAG: arylsulfatase [Bacteroidota bacterium]